MKKASLQTLVNYIVDNDVTELSEIKDELAKELAKDEVRKQETAKGYEDAHDVIVGALEDAPATCGEIYDAIKAKLPEGFGKGKVQYALTHLWQDEIVVIEGKPNTYRKAI